MNNMLVVLILRIKSCCIYRELPEWTKGASWKGDGCIATQGFESLTLCQIYPKCIDGKHNINYNCVFNDSDKHLQELIM